MYMKSIQVGVGVHIIYSCVYIKVTLCPWSHNVTNKRHQAERYGYWYKDAIANKISGIVVSQKADGLIYWRMLHDINLEYQYRIIGYVYFHHSVQGRQMMMMMMMYWYLKSN